MDEIRRRRAENELFFRSLNDRIEQVGEEAFPSSDERGRRAYDFVCECHDASCTERFAMTVAEYEAIRTDATQFVVAPSEEHVDHAIEKVVDRAARYWIVRKLGEAAEWAEAADGRDDAGGGTE